MSERDSFMHAICAEPADDTARLVFADWLEENGHPARAGYIRHQVLHPLDEKPNHGNNGEPLPVLFQSEPTVTRITGMLTHDIRGYPHEVGRWYRRGFVYRVALPLYTFLVHARELFANHPITEVAICDRTPWLIPGRRQWAWHNREFPLNARADITHCTNEGDLLPPAIFNRLGNHEPRAEAILRIVKYYRTKGDAVWALSRALVDHGREAAGLRPLWSLSPVGVS